MSTHIENFSVSSNKFRVNSDGTSTSLYNYSTTRVEGNVVYPTEENFLFQTDRKVPKTGLMLVGWGGNNGTTATAGILANKHEISWMTKEGKVNANYYGSLVQSSTVRIGLDPAGDSVYTPFCKMLPMVHPNDLILGGWDISSMNLADAMKRAKVLDFNLQSQLEPFMKDMKPLPSIYNPDFIAANQVERADNTIPGTKQQQLEQIRADIRKFKTDNKLDKVIVLWTANTERFANIEKGVNDTADNLLSAIKKNEAEISPSTIFAVACILEGVSYINGSPQNTFVPGVMELADRENSFIAGDDFKSGQTKMKSVLVDFLVSAGIKPTSIVSYNHLGNNDGYNLSSPAQFRSKEISKSNVVDDMVDSNRILYDDAEHPDHVVVIKYVPYVADSKRAMDEYTSEIFMGGKNTIVMHNTCEDSLLATPIIYDLVILCEMCERIKLRRTSQSTIAEAEEKEKDAPFEKFHSVLSLLSYLLKAPLVPNGTPVVNALFAQRQAIVNVFRACCGLGPDNYMTLEHRVPSLIKAGSSLKKVQESPVSDSNTSGEDDSDVNNKKRRVA